MKLFQKLFPFKLFLWTCELKVFFQHPFFFFSNFFLRHVVCSIDNLVEFSPTKAEKVKIMVRNGWQKKQFSNKSTFSQNFPENLKIVAWTTSPGTFFKQCRKQVAPCPKTIGTFFSNNHLLSLTTMQKRHEEVETFLLNVRKWFKNLLTKKEHYLSWFSKGHVECPLVIFEENLSR